MDEKISIKTTEEGSVRAVAVQVFLLSLAAVLWGVYLPLLFLVPDFFIRAFLSPRFSPTAMAAKKGLARFLKFKKKTIVLRPKRFAAGIGFVMSLSALVLGLLDQILLMRIIVGVLALFSFLEAFFRFCAGCKIFSLLIRMGLADEGLCTDCVYPGGDGI